MTGLPPSRLAVGAGLSDTTLSRLLNDSAYDGTLSEASIRRLMATYEVVHPDQFREGQPLAAMRGDLEPVNGNATLDKITARPGLDRYTLKTRSLDALGYLPGDYVFVDTSKQPRTGDLVLAHVRDGVPLGYEIVFRMFEPPYLVAASTAPTYRRPLLVDGERVQVRGVVVASARVFPDA